MKPVAVIVAYFLAVVFAGAVLAPWLYGSGQWVAARGVMPFLAETEFQKFFNRAALVAAVALLWPTVRALRIGGWQELGLERDARWARHLGVGFVLATLLVALLAATYIGLEVYRWKKVLAWTRLPGLLLSAFAVAVVEEALFRGALLGVFRRAMRPLTALFWVTAIFAIVHFLKPDDRIVIEQVTWASGFALLPHIFHQFTQPVEVLAGFTTLFVLGSVLGFATLWTRSLWLAIGFHAGVVFVKMSFSKFTKREAEYLPWIGEKLEIGLVPVAVLASGGVLIWVWLRYVDRSIRPASE